MSDTPTRGPRDERVDDAPEGSAPPPVGVYERPAAADRRAPPVVMGVAILLLIALLAYLVVTFVL